MPISNPHTRAFPAPSTLSLTLSLPLSASLFRRSHALRIRALVALPPPRSLPKLGMSTRSAGSQLAAAAAAPSPTSSSGSGDSEKAWHLLSLLLSLGRPSSPLELASTCELFPAPPDLVRRLCGIPNSPICLAGDSSVTLSVAALVSLARFLTSSNLVSFFCSPRVERLRFGKRKGSELECEGLPPAKRRANWESCVDEIVYPDIIKGNPRGFSCV